jgi:hypothetical protein
LAIRQAFQAGGWKENFQASESPTAALPRFCYIFIA